MLFKSENLLKNVFEPKPFVMETTDSTDEVVLIGRGHRVIKDIIPELINGKSIHFATQGHFHLHELVERILHFTGPAKYYTTTWAISEAPMRKILDLVQSGFITEIHALFDYKTKAHAPKAFHLIEGITSRVALTHIHAKVKVIETEEHCISISSSANDTNNSRWEAGVITPNKKISMMHRDWIMNEITNQNETK